MRSFRPLAIAMLFGIVVQSVPGRAQTAPLPAPLRMSTFAVNMANIATGANARIEIQVDRWSTEAQRQHLVSTFREKGPGKLLDALQDSKPVGFLKLPTRLSYDLRFARQTPIADGGTRIVLLTDRPLNYTEVETQARTLDYPFTLIEIHLKKDGTGTGKLSLATKIELDKKDNSVVLENWDTEPIRLNEIHIEK